MEQNDRRARRAARRRRHSRAILGFATSALVVSAIFLQTLQPSLASSSSTHATDPPTTTPTSLAPARTTIPLSHKKKVTPTTVPARPTTTTRPPTVTSTTHPLSVTTTTVHVTTTTTVVSRSTLHLPPSGHCTILEIGDSLGNNIGYGMKYELEHAMNVTMLVESKPSTGLSNSWYYSWPQHLRTYLAQYHPQLVVVFIGANDEQGMTVNGHVVNFATPAWRTEYAARVAQIMKIATASGAAVMWFGMPIMGPYSYSQGMKVLNSIVEATAKTVPRVTFLSTWNFVAGPTGQFQMSRPVNHSWAVIRHPDGIHFSEIGQNVLGTYAVTELRVVYRFPVLASFPMAFTG